MSKRYEMKILQNYGDTRSSMCVIEAEKELPFKIQRLFYDFNTTNCDMRGNHANLYSRFAFISLSGYCKVSVDDGVNKEEFFLDNPTKMLVIDKLVWKSMTGFSNDSVLLIISDCMYNKDEYIREYDKFMELIMQFGFADLQS